MKGQEMPVNLTFIIIIGIIAVVVIVGIILMIKSNLVSYINTALPHPNSTSTVVETNVQSIDTLSLDIISCYNKKENGLCYLVYYNGTNSFSCSQLIDNVLSIDPNVQIQNCNYYIKQGDYILINSNINYVYLSLQ
ncbi:hypothetical protein [Nanobdella aerobiophila]|nr:hypothetical protein [Nanobdella aerobiophila]